MSANEISPSQMFQWVMKHGGVDVSLEVSAQMNIIINILQYLVPIFIRFIDKHSDEFLENLYHKISLKLGGNECLP